MWEKNTKNTIWNLAKRLIVVISAFALAFIGRNIRLNNLANTIFKETITSTDIIKINSFLNEYPNSEHVDEMIAHRHAVESLYYQKHFAQSEHYVADTINTLFYLDNFQGEPHYKEIQDLHKQLMEYNEYLLAESCNSISVWKEYIEMHPNSPYYNEALEQLAKIESEVKEMADNDDYQIVISENTIESCRQYLIAHPDGKYRSQVKSRINKLNEIERYKHYSPPNGSQPWAQFYGSNFAKDDRLNVVIIKASYDYNAVIIAKDIQSNKVRGHIYVQKNKTAQFYLPNGQYEMTFYYGNGWYPQLKIHYGSSVLKGGFIENDYMVADKEILNFQYHSDYTESITYTLKPMVNGNVKTKHIQYTKEF